MGILSNIRVALIAALLPISVFHVPPVRADTLEEGRAAIGQKDYEEALRLLMPLAEQGNPVAQNAVGELYHNGWGVKQDHGEAVKWFRKAAEQGDAIAQTSLGKMYFAGEGVEQDFTEALKWYRRAAPLGSAQAQFSLGMMYELGLGVARDKAEGLRWYRLSADQDYPGAMERVEALTPTAAPGALRVPSLDEALAASATDLAKSLFFTRQVTRIMLPFVEKTGAKVRTGLIPGLEIDRDHLQVIRSVLEARLAIYESAARQRGCKEISGKYRAKATSSCARTKSMWATGAAQIRDLNIKQDGSDILIGHGSALEASGVVVESIIVFTDPMNTDYPFTGKIETKKLTIRPDVDTVLAAWPGWAGPPSRKYLEKCKVTLVPRN